MAVPRCVAKSLVKFHQEKIVKLGRHLDSLMSELLPPDEKEQRRRELEEELRKLNED